MGPPLLHLHPTSNFPCTCSWKLVGSWNLAGSCPQRQHALPTQHLAASRGAELIEAGDRGRSIRAPGNLSIRHVVALPSRENAVRPPSNPLGCQDVTPCMGPPLLHLHPTSNFPCTCSWKLVGSWNLAGSCPQRQHALPTQHLPASRGAELERLPAMSHMQHSAACMELPCGMCHNSPCALARAVVVADVVTATKEWSPSGQQQQSQLNMTAHHPGEWVGSRVAGRNWQSQSQS
jgi:hypothetical protein